MHLEAAKGHNTLLLPTNGVGSTIGIAIADKNYNYHFPPARRQPEELYRTNMFNELSMQQLAGSLRDTEQLGVAEKRRDRYCGRRQEESCSPLKRIQRQLQHDT